MYWVERARGNKSTTYKSPTRLLKSPVLMVSGICTSFSPENPNELIDTMKVPLQEKQVGKNSNINNEEIVAIADKLFDYKRISTEQHRFLIKKI